MQMGGERKKKEKKKKQRKELLKILSKKNVSSLYCAFIRTPHAFFLLSLPDTVSYVQANCDTLSGHHTVRLPDGSLPILARGSELQWKV